MTHPSTTCARPTTYMPAEWQPHAATWLSWPRNRDTWPHNLAEVQAEFKALVQAIAEDEPVFVLAGPDEDEQAATAALGSIPQVTIVPIQTNDAWARDYAPTFTINPQRWELVAVGWQYNAWGGKYPPFDDDQQVARRVAEFLDCQFQPVDLVIEGGALEVDDSGLLLCTKSCAFDPHRNPDLAPEEIERTIQTAIGAEQMIWLTGDALIGDDTDGHIDQLARCTPSGAILYAWTDNSQDPQHIGLTQNLGDLREGLKRCGISKPLIPLLLPDPVFFRGVQIPACYCNFYITNRSVIVPQFGVAQDAHAAAVIAEHFPGRRLVCLPSVHLTVGLGSFHCLTQQQPLV
ncbi:MAG TPA: agmatine deiminase family protein [Pirellulaceae bacterium]|nr:agmatine deiminase family protein [Pirellulaceae bacterium]